MAICTPGLHGLVEVSQDPSSGAAYAQPLGASAGPSHAAWFSCALVSAPPAWHASA
jgi:hypothetical protein